MLQSLLSNPARVFGALLLGSAVAAPADPGVTLNRKESGYRGIW